MAGHSARFITASDLLLDLNGQETARALERRLRHYARPALLAIDEIGYLAYDAHAADLLFQIGSRRYEHRSLLMTTNLAFKHWDTIFPNASCAVALIDRLTHHAEIVVIEGTATGSVRPSSARNGDGPRRVNGRDHGRCLSRITHFHVTANTGRGVVQDYVQAHMWRNLAASRQTGEDRELSVEARDALADLMTPKISAKPNACH